MISFRLNKKVNFSLCKDYLLKNQYEEVISAFHSLKISDIKLKKDKISFFYPGCGSDIFKPLLILDSIAEFTEADIFLVDFFLSPESIKENIKYLTRIKKVKESYIDDRLCQQYKFKDKILNIFYLENDVLKLEDFPVFDIYFERAFQLFRKDSPEFGKKVIANLNKDGLLISDFIDFPETDLKKLVIPNNFSEICFYKKSFGILKKIN